MVGNLPKGQRRRLQAAGLWLCIRVYRWSGMGREQGSSAHLLPVMLLMRLMRRRTQSRKAPRTSACV